MKQLFSFLIAAIFATASAWSAEETIALKDGSFANNVITWTGTSCTITQEKAKASTAPNSSYVANPRWYASNLVTFAAKEGYKITGATVTCTSASYATALQKSTFTGATATVTGSVVTITCSADSGFAVTMGAQARISSVKVTYEATAPGKTVTSLVVAGAPATTEYYVGENFDQKGLTVTATYDDETSEDVTAKVSWAFDPATIADTTKSVLVTATYGSVSASVTCPVTVKTIANTKETAYTVEEAIALIEAGKGLDTPVYVKGIVSKIVTAFNAKYGNVSFNVSDDGSVSADQFEFFRTQKDAENLYTEDPKIAVGASVIGYGKLTKYNSTYEFAAGNYLVEYVAPSCPGDLNGDGVVDASDLTVLCEAIVNGDGSVTLEAGDLNEDGVLDVTDATILVNLIAE